VTGVSTAFAANTRIGDSFIGPDGRQYELANVASDTVISILPAYLGPTTTGASYAVAPIQGYQKGLADQVRDWVNSYGPKMAALGTTGNYETLPLSKGGTGATNQADARTALGIDAVTPITKGGTGATSALAARTALGVLSSGRGYIDGLYPVRVSGNTLNILPGAAYVPGINDVISAPLLTLSGLALAPSTWYYLYLWNNNGNASVEIVTTVPSEVYSGTARVKSTDTTRRFIGAVLTNASGNLIPFWITADNFLNYQDTTTVTPFRCVSGATQTTPTAVSLASAVPMTSRSVRLHINNSGNATSYLGTPDFTGVAVQAGTAGVRYNTTFFTDASQRIMFYLASAGGALSIDVTGYGMER
jgi:hypothetical protein